MTGTTIARDIEVAEVASRDEAFRRLAEVHLDASYRLARAILRDDAEAQDATHDAFVRAWRKWSTLRDPDLFERWFRQILVNTCRNRRRRGARWRVWDISAELQLEASGTPAPDGVESAEDRLLLDAALGRLGEDDRTILALRFCRDLQIDEIARTIDVPSGTVKSRLHHALRRLHDVLEADMREVPR